MYRKVRAKVTEDWTVQQEDDKVALATVSYSRDHPPTHSHTHQSVSQSVRARTDGISTSCLVRVGRGHPEDGQDDHGSC